MLVHKVIDLDLIKRFGHVTPDLPTHLENSHTTTSQVAQVAQSAGVAKVVLTHLVPSSPRLIPDLVWQAQCSVGYGGSVHVGNDLDQISIPVRTR